MHSAPKVSVVILNFNGRDFLGKFLPPVLRSTYPNMEVVVADNGSTDDSVSFLRNAFPSVRLLISGQNEGFAGGYNTALKQVSADYYMLLNSDVEVQPGWLEPLVDLMDADKSIAACQPKLLSWSDRRHFEYAGASGGWIDALGYPFMRGRIMDYCEEDKGQYDRAEPCFWASGAALMVRSEAYWAAGGLDPWFFAHQEEIDLCWRLHMAGFRVFVQPASVVFHVGGGTLAPSPRKIFLNFRNNLIMIFKNLPPGQLIWKFPLRLGLNGLAALHFLAAGRPAYFGAVMKSFWAFMVWLVRGRKKSVFPVKRRALSGEGWYKGCLLWDYYIKKKNTFSRIVGRN